jgi:hypothetical protein
LKIGGTSVPPIAFGLRATFRRSAHKPSQDSIHLSNCPKLARYFGAREQQFLKLSTSRKRALTNEFFGVTNHTVEPHGKRND